MAESIQEIFKRKLVPVGFQRTMGLLGQRPWASVPSWVRASMCSSALPPDRPGPPYGSPTWSADVEPSLGGGLCGAFPKGARYGGGICVRVQCPWELLGIYDGLASGPGEHFCLRHVCNRLCLLPPSSSSLRFPEPIIRDGPRHYRCSHRAQLPGYERGRQGPKVVDLGKPAGASDPHRVGRAQGGSRACEPRVSQGVDGVGGAIAIIYVLFWLSTHCQQCGGDCRSGKNRSQGHAPGHDRELFTWPWPSFPCWSSPGNPLLHQRRLWSMCLAGIGKMGGPDRPWGCSCLGRRPEQHPAFPGQADLRHGQRQVFTGHPRPNPGGL